MTRCPVKALTSTRSYAGPKLLPVRRGRQALRCLWSGESAMPCRSDSLKLCLTSRTGSAVLTATSHSHSHAMLAPQHLTFATWRTGSCTCCNCFPLGISKVCKAGLDKEHLRVFAGAPCSGPNSSSAEQVVLLCGLIIYAVA